jgi:putative FmdB family regulatory protein
MPVYSFRCAKCRSEIDRHLGFDEKLSEKCECGGKFSKVFQLSGVRFKGAGFYRNDNQVNRPKED